MPTWNETEIAIENIWDFKEQNWKVLDNILNKWHHCLTVSIDKAAKATRRRKRPLPTNCSSSLARSLFRKLENAFAILSIPLAHDGAVVIWISNFPPHTHA